MAKKLIEAATKKAKELAAEPKKKQAENILENQQSGAEADSSS